jgi:hypothetical protein
MNLEGRKLMLKWKITNSDEKMLKEIKNCKSTFDNWFKNSSWINRYTKDEFLSENSPLPYVYYKICKSPEEVKEKFSGAFKETCSSCGNQADEWIETSFSFCDEYGCGMKLCMECAEKLRDKLNEFISK